MGKIVQVLHNNDEYIIVLDEFGKAYWTKLETGRAPHWYLLEGPSN